MKQELEEYRLEAAHLKNQQATIRRLEERNRSLEQQVPLINLNKPNASHLIPVFQFRTLFYFIAYCMDPFILVTLDGFMDPGSDHWLDSISFSQSTLF